MHSEICWRKNCKQRNYLGRINVLTLIRSKVSSFANYCSRPELTQLSTTGNEEEHIIISLVRSDKVGFLKNIRRTNVMLSRCKRSMVICTSRAFLNGIASSSLVGTLAKVLGDQAWLNWP